MNRSRNYSRIARTVDTLSDQAQQAADQTANPLTEVVLAIRAAMAGSVDAYLLTGALLEAIAQILSTKIPPELRSATELATVVLLKQRLASTRIVCGGPPDYCNPAPETI